MPDRQSELVESSVSELVEMLRAPLTDAERARMTPDDGNLQEPDVYTVVLNSFTQRNTEALVKCE